ncbi:MAG: TonB-dependent receptor [Reyranella sp.]|uniref:TonB-dependent receptor n=1 Tax=Reyranella sp. TaxID=1929291 RepID=UPI0012036069|nr:TonB-dependent receptor [Reyranella sp.]TAJ90922.1 MAG: TonB-dependent receptor [Reyranella sp.]TBR29021.1 MAG: TonB-dependent receptor [Reyranella sp.]
MRESEIGSAKKMHRGVAGAVAAAAVLLLQAPARADNHVVPPVAGEQLAQSSQPRSFAIPAQPLASALDRFADQTGISFAYRTGDISTIRSPGVSGMLAPREALQQLLAGTGVSFAFTGANTVTITKAPDAGSGAMQLDAVQVQGLNQQSTIDNLPPPYAGGQVATGGREGFLGNRDTMDTPFTSTSYTSTLVQNQQARTIADVVANDAAATKYGLSMFDQFRIRGFLLGAGGVSFDGLYGLVQEDRVPVEAFERVEVFRGPSAFLNGYVGAVGGTINLSPKKAGAQPLTSAGASYNTSGQVGAVADVGRRFGKDGAFGIRFNGLYRDGYTPLQNNKERVGNAALALDYAGSNVRLATYFGYTKQDTMAGNQLFIMSANQQVPAAPNAMSAVQQPWETIDTEFVYGMARGEVDLANDWIAFAAYGQSYFRENWLRTIGRNMTAQGRFLASGQQYSRTFWKQTGEVGVRGKMKTGPISHSMAMVATGYWEVVGSTFLPFAFSQSTNLYNPVMTSAPASGAFNYNPPKASATSLGSFALTDTLSAFDERVQVMLGARNQSIQNDNFTTTGALSSSYFASALSPAVGAIVKPWQNVSLYGNYIQALQQGPTAPTTAVNAGQIFAPTQSWQLEVGAKVDFGKWTATLGLFEITQPAGITNPATSVFSVDGQQVNQGIELNVFGEPIEGVRLLGGLMLLNARLTQTAGGTFNGMKAPASPDVTLKLGAEWDTPFMKALTLTGRVNFFSGQYINEANTQAIPAYTLVGVGARYRFEVDHKPIALRANVENLFNESSWQSGYTGGIVYRGTPRTIYVSLTADF